MKSDKVIDVIALMRKRGICVIIPTFNNAATIKNVINDVAQYCEDIIVVNDGCTDNTLDVLHNTPNITVVGYGRNRGKGYALKTGMVKALELGFAYAITMDADGQHLAKDIPTFLKANMDYPGALIMGDRTLRNIPLSKGSRFANNFSNFWFCIQTWHWLDDTQTGYRLYPLKKLYGLKLMTSRYEAELELIVLSAWFGIKIVPVPIEVYYPPKNERVSYFIAGKDFARISLLNTILCILSLIFAFPLRIVRWLLVFLRTLYSLLFLLLCSFFVLTPGALIYLIFLKKKGQNNDFLNVLIHKLAKFVVISHGIPGAKFRYKIASGVDFNKPHIVVCNHQSHFDIICQLIFSPKMVFMTNDWVWNNPLYGFPIRNAGYLHATEGLEELLSQMEDLVKRGYSIAVYPEGTRSKTGLINRFHKGAFYFAKRLNLDILPMVLYGMGQILPPKACYMRKGIMVVEVGLPITREELDAMGDLRIQSLEVHRLYVQKYMELKNDVDKDI